MGEEPRSFLQVYAEIVLNGGGSACFKCFCRDDKEDELITAGDEKIVVNSTRAISRQRNGPKGKDLG